MWQKGPDNETIFLLPKGTFSIYPEIWREFSLDRSKMSHIAQ